MARRGTSVAAVTGCAGFIGAPLVRALAKRHPDVHGVDLNARAVGALRRPLGGSEVVFHLAADPDVRNSTNHPFEHFDQNVMGTLAVLEGCRKHDVSRIVFPSTSTVYGDAKVVPTPESYAPLRPISVYGAGKLACEGLLSSFSATYGIDAVVLRFANVVGPGATHGVIPDLVDKLKRDPKRLEVLGDGRQRKSYIHIDDLIRGILKAEGRAPKGFQVYNVGSADTLVVDRIAGAVIRAMGLGRVEIVHKPAPGGRGWAGDVKVMQLSIARLGKLGYRPKYSSAQAVEAAARAVAAERAGPTRGAREGLTRNNAPARTRGSVG